MVAFGFHDGSNLAEVFSSGGLSIWCPKDPVHLTPTAYGEVAEHLIKKEAFNWRMWPAPV